VGGSVNVNAASYADLIAAGFTPQEAESVQNYRMKTGGFHRLEDLEFAGVAPGRVQELAPGLSLTGGEGD
jgi:DNA uptake protein ComE-like DNA-binding protein